MSSSCTQLSANRRGIVLVVICLASYIAVLPSCTAVQKRQSAPPDMLLLDKENKTGNASAECAKRDERISCPDAAIKFYLYSGGSGVADEIDTRDPGWFSRSSFNPELPTVMLVHGYRGGDSLMPTVVLKNAYIKRGTYNLITVDYGPLAQTPCYVQAVSNLKPIAKCTSHMLSYLRTNQVQTEKITCVGFSLGSHVCGLLDNYLSEKMERIIALDPARPLLSTRWETQKLSPDDATQVLVVHTNAGFYGQTGWTGTIDFCVNNGAQPYCSKSRNEQLCSHAHAVCYMAQSLWKDKSQIGEPCGNRCPQPNFFSRRGFPVIMGEFTPATARGTYCVRNEAPPYCLGIDPSDPTFGDVRCCPVAANSSIPRIGKMLSDRRMALRQKMWHKFSDDYLL